MLVNEHIVTFSEAAAKLPRFNGKRPHASTIWRWARKGLNGITLETRRVGGRFVTSIEALERFTIALSKVEVASKSKPEIAKPATNSQRARSIERAERGLQRAGIL